jgi:hypothetical protein
VWLAVNTEHFEPRARSSRSILDNSACPMPRRRCDGLTYMSAHQVALTASTLRTRPNDVLSIECYVLAEWSIIPEQIA